MAYLRVERFIPRAPRRWVRKGWIIWKVKYLDHPWQETSLTKQSNGWFKIDYSRRHAGPMPHVFKFPVGKGRGDIRIPTFPEGARLRSTGMQTFSQWSRYQYLWVEIILDD